MGRRFREWLRSAREAWLAPKFAGGFGDAFDGVGQPCRLHTKSAERRAPSAERRAPSAERRAPSCVRGEARRLALPPPSRATLLRSDTDLSAAGAPAASACPGAAAGGAGRHVFRRLPAPAFGDEAPCRRGRGCCRVPARPPGVRRGSRAVALRSSGPRPAWYWRPPPCWPCRPEYRRRRRTRSARPGPSRPRASRTATSSG